ncbi:MAG: ATP synthase F1 subunit epsilon [Candidatus Jacksonbacteria bacterium RIFOXYA2_FULL_44_7]|uniref:ATP synthase epsilon chain n=1 Tax=Candidatus Jacksonbacteria bacterium RIFCSPLOWO2_02_FULL_44_20 TaxID=1798460 RepID=A0A1G2A7H8_9BACT|nr:MAG: ATP synthase epsilon chain [Parcubacteria group bacterium GW2011_GWC2_44_17]KKT49699.1 MAG: ATP synthase epsilon chain [Parcubacteria group bacterium GW2011_GWF2_44_17]OGY70057.1 MAG: ATP synthase F1 subunit epsilon [Candidatus Jacksonbacteria bacterium RIFCSPHIGHO2_12_FULL_44_12]OGY71734.1 MAG: ATP synthase F1 subunit epsilon [Candidatus Jacksonbacteria bacterium RIFCSPHIGHO2_02_FULL_44_25]OGY72619.1 MAG: ATP synthase F1 subunit epsilon [Candidatus Jacksonbacteria bacterium RIFCSPLOWO2
MFHLRITTLERVVFDEETESVTLPGVTGEFTVLSGHIPFITSLKLGEITARNKAGEFFMGVSGGMAEVTGERVLVLADQAERAEEIDEQLAEEARNRAEALMSEKRGSGEVFAAAEAELQQSLLRLKIARKHRTKKSVTH